MRTPPFSGQHGPLLFNDPWWKVALLVLDAQLSDDANLFERGQSSTVPKEGELTVSEVTEFFATVLAGIMLGYDFGGLIDWVYKRTLDSGRVLEHRVEKEPYRNVHLLDSYNVDVDWKHEDDGIYTHNRRCTLYVSASFVKPRGEDPQPETLFEGQELYVMALLISDDGQKIIRELRDEGRFQTRPNTGVYTVGIDGMQLTDGKWYVFVLAQDTNTTLEGTDPRVAAKKTGGMILTGQYLLAIGGKRPCELNHDALITTITGPPLPRK